MGCRPRFGRGIWRPANLDQPKCLRLGASDSAHLFRSGRSRPALDMQSSLVKDSLTMTDITDERRETDLIAMIHSSYHIFVGAS